MNAGKSIALLQVAHNYESHGRNVRVYTSARDHRFGSGVVTSRLGPQRESLTFDTKLDFIEDLKGQPELSCILIDEAQFLTPQQVRQLHKLAHTGDVPVICYGIRSDFLGEAFPGAAALLTLSDSLEEIKTICACGRKATMNVRVDEAGRRITTGAQIAIEGEHRYIQTCGSCFYSENTPHAP